MQEANKQMLNLERFQVAVRISIHPSGFILSYGDTWRHFDSETGDDITVYKPGRWL